MSKHNTVFVKVGLSFFFWSLLGPIFNLSSFTAYQNIWLISFLPIVYILSYAVIFGKIGILKQIRINGPFLLFMLTSGFSGVLWLYSLTLLPIANAVFLYSSAPVFTLLLSILFIKEKIYSIRLFAIFLGIVGIVVLLSENLKGFSLSIGSIVVLISALLTASQALVSKKYFLHYPTWVTVLLIMISQAIITFPFALSHSWKSNELSLIGALFLSIFSSIIAFIFYVDGLRVLKASTVTLVGYIEPFLAGLWGYLFLQQFLSSRIILGGVLILIAGYFTVRSENK